MEWLWRGAAVVPAERHADEDNESYATASDGQPDEMALNGAREMEMAISVGEVLEADDDDVKDPALNFPESTHSFLFTEPVGSFPFVFSLGIAAISYTCLALALINNLSKGSIPTNVVWSVRIAQYLSILITFLMEEEIPTGLYLLRMISKPNLKSKIPEISYPKFVCSSVLRITMGYLFLINVMVVLLQADGMIEIFYDCLALQFLQRLDDIGFSIAKIEVLGKRLQRATMTSYFQVDFRKEKESLALKWRARTFLKAVYFINLAGLLTAMIFVSVEQIRGRYQCGSITVGFGDEVWSDAIVQWPSYSRQYPPGLVEERVLAYSYFNGQYIKDPDRTQEGRPVYVEQKKSDRTPFDTTTPSYNPYHEYGADIDPVWPAEIKYCGGRWIFSHDYIRKSKKDKAEEIECNWIARSPETDGFDLLDVKGKWQIWSGVIVETDISIRDNECSDDSDCNLNGVCNSDGKCDCDADEDAVYLGTHCEVKLEDDCRIIIGEQYNDTWSVGDWAFSDKALALMEGIDYFSEYSRPVYSYIEGLPDDQAPPEGGSISLIYSGRRWFRIYLEGAQNENASEFWAWMSANYHAFWSGAYEPGVTTLVSEPTDKDTPVGVDFYYVGDRNQQFGPFGLLVPAQKHNMTGRGVYRCQRETCSFCTNSTIIDKDYVIPDDFFVSRATGYTCGFLYEYVQAWDENSFNCQEVKMTEQVCCPP